MSSETEFIGSDLRTAYMHMEAARRVAIGEALIKAEIAAAFAEDRPVKRVMRDPRSDAILVFDVDAGDQQRIYL